MIKPVYDMYNNKGAYIYMSRIIRKPDFCICENEDADQLPLIRAFVFAIRIVQSLYYLNPKFQASNHLLSQYSLVCVGPGRKPQRPVFSQRGSYQPVLISSFLFVAYI